MRIVSCPTGAPDWVVILTAVGCPVLVQAARILPCASGYKRRVKPTE